MAGAATVLLTYGDSIVAGCLTDFKTHHYLHLSHFGTSSSR